MVKDQAYFGLQPFCSTCPAPAVSALPVFAFYLLSLSQSANSYFYFLQLDDSFWKSPAETETESRAGTAKGKESTSAAAETVDEEESSEESSKEAAAAGDENEDEESSPEAPTTDVVEEESSPEAPTTNVVEEESSSEAQYADEEHTESSPTGAQPTPSEESSEARDT